MKERGVSHVIKRLMDNNMPMTLVPGCFGVITVIRIIAWYKVDCTRTRVEHVSQPSSQPMKGAV